MDPDCGESHRYRYDVFISFRGPDTRNTFVNHLYAHLTRKGISTFKDDKSLQKGESISPQLLQAIKDSGVSIVVFSKDYASSTWCLDEMVAIDECSRKLKRVVFTVFYDINPSHVRKQSGVYEDAFVLHTELFKHDPDKVAQWKRVMTSLAGSVGWDVRNKPEFEEIEQIVQAVIKKLGHKFSRPADDLIGIQTRLDALESLLKPSSKDDSFQVLGIRGMGGIGKTTLATVLYDRISSQFDACCYIENVRKVYEDGGASALQKQILCQTMQEKILDTYNPSEIARIVRYRLQHIKFLVVLDNVDQIEQLHDLDIKHLLLHPESRLIIITRDEHILTTYGCIVYEVELMNDDEAHKLLCKKAFVSDYSSSTFSELIPEVLKYTQGLPLAIRVIGSFLHSRNAKQWRATLNRWKNSPPDEILKVLEVSYDGLFKEDKEIFLHVACFFKGERKDYVSRVLDACDLQPDIGIPLLAENSLITIKNEEIHMHEMLQELGKKIVRGEHPDEPIFWSRLWLYRHFHHVMMTEKKAIEAEAIILNLKEDDFESNELRAEDLPKMERLKLLILNHKNFSGRPSFLSNSLRHLLWNGYPFISLPSNFQPYHLVELSMPHSSVEQLWTDIQEPRHFRCGFDIITPWEYGCFLRGFDYQFDWDSIIRIKESDIDVDSLGYLFSIVFKVNNHSEVSDSPHQSLSSPMPHPFYLSFESEHTEERFDIPLNLEQNMVDGSTYIWTIYISREHCHFVKTGAQITFKARQGLIIKEWGLCVLTKEDIEGSELRQSIHLPLQIVKVEENSISSSLEPKIQLPYNWFVSDEDEAERDGAKGKETDLFNLGLFTGS